MSTKSPIFHWFLPTSGDGHNALDLQPGAMSTSRGARDSVAYLSQVARAADDLGFDAVLTPVGTECEEPWILTAGLARETQDLRFMVAVRPTTITPTLVAQMSTTFQRLSGGAPRPSGRHRFAHGVMPLFAGGSDRDRTPAASG